MIEPNERLHFLRREARNYALDAVKLADVHLTPERHAALTAEMVGEAFRSVNPPRTETELRAHAELTNDLYHLAPSIVQPYHYEDASQEPGLERWAFAHERLLAIATRTNTPRQTKEEWLKSAARAAARETLIEALGDKVLAARVLKLDDTHQELVEKRLTDLAAQKAKPNPGDADVNALLFELNHAEVSGAKRKADDKLFDSVQKIADVRAIRFSILANQLRVVMLIAKGHAGD